MVPRRHGTTILPWGWQTGGRPGGCRRTRKRLRFRLRSRTRSETDFDANDNALGFLNGFGFRTGYDQRLRARLRLRLRLRFRRRRAWRRRSRHSSGYVQTNAEIYFERRNRFSILDSRLTIGGRRSRRSGQVRSKVSEARSQKYGLGALARLAVSRFPPDTRRPTGAPPP
jgi:hypothetical protein